MIAADDQRVDLRQTRTRFRWALRHLVLSELDRLAGAVVISGIVWSPAGFVTPGPGLNAIRATFAAGTAARRSKRELERRLADAARPPAGF